MIREGKTIALRDLTIEITSNSIFATISEYTGENLDILVSRSTGEVIKLVNYVDEKLKENDKKIAIDFFQKIIDEIKKL